MLRDFYDDALDWLDALAFYVALRVVTESAREDSKPWPKSTPT